MRTVQSPKDGLKDWRTWKKREQVEPNQTIAWLRSARLLRKNLGGLLSLKLQWENHQLHWYEGPPPMIIIIKAVSQEDLLLMCLKNIPKDLQKRQEELETGRKSRLLGTIELLRSLRILRTGPGGLKESYCYSDTSEKPTS